MSSNPLPPGVDITMPTFDEITVQNYQILTNLLEQQWPLLSDLYDSCTMDPSELSNITRATFSDVSFLNFKKISIFFTYSKSNAIIITQS